MRREWVWAAGLVVAGRVTGALSPRVRYRWAARMGRWTSRLFPSKRRAVGDNLSRLGLTGERRRRVDRVFENFAMTLADFLGGRTLDVTVDGWPHVEAARAAGRGALLATCHLGNWELGGRVLEGRGGPVTAVYQPYRSRAMQGFIQRRRAPGLNYLAVGRGAAHGVLKALRRGDTVAVLADRPFGEDGAPVMLCGRPARLPRGPFVLACRQGTPVLPGFVIMESPGRYRCVVEAPVWPAGPDDVKIVMDKMAQVLGKYIMAHPDQWFCFEPAWDT